MVNQNAIERNWATYLSAIQAKIPCPLHEIQQLLRDMFPDRQDACFANIIEDVHDFQVSLFEKNETPRSYQDVCKAVEQARDAFFKRYPLPADTCPNCGSKSGMLRSGGYPSEIGFRVAGLGYYETADCMADRSGFQRFCTKCKHVWMAAEKASNAEVLKHFAVRRDEAFIGYWSHS